MGMVPPRGMGNDSRNRTHGRDALSGGNGRGRHGGGSDRGWHGGGSRGCRKSGAEVGPRLELSVGGGEDCLTLGRNLCPSRVLTMAWLEKDKRWREEEERTFHK